MKLKSILMATALAFSTSVFAEGAQKQQSEQQRQQAKQTYQDISQAQSLNHLHHMNQKEVEISNLATEKAQSQEVKDLAKTIAEDHKKADQKLQEVAKSLNVELQDFQPATYEKVVIDKLDKLEGQQFEQAYLKQMEEGHKTAMNEIENIEKELKNEQVSSYIDNLKPDLKKHDERTSNVISSQGFAE